MIRRRRLRAGELRRWRNGCVGAEGKGARYIGGPLESAVCSSPFKLQLARPRVVNPPSSPTLVSPLLPASPPPPAYPHPHLIYPPPFPASLSVHCYPLGLAIPTHFQRISAHAMAPTDMEKNGSIHQEEGVQMLQAHEKASGDLLPSPVSATSPRPASSNKPKLSAATIIPIWIVLSSAVIIYNNYLYNTLQFRFPVFLVTWHLTFAVSITFFRVPLHRSITRVGLPHTCARSTLIAAPAGSGYGPPSNCTARRGRRSAGPWAFRQSVATARDLPRLSMSAFRPVPLRPSVTEIVGC